ncbi:TonB-dependent receptor [Bordetella sp. N]|uniref:TonB-dependent siderophore receptor n=1 Tax=Bordetella sp. N TaxID=1746199 RepID=UPI0009E74B28
MNRNRSTPRLAPLAAFSRRSLSGNAAAALLGGLIFAAPSHAQHAPAQTPEARNYQIGAGSLTSVLTRFIAESGIVLAGSADLARDKASPGVSGRYTPEQGLAALLTGTGLHAVRNGRGAFVLETAPVTELAPVAVVGGAVGAATLPDAYAGGEVARGGRLGLLGNTDVMDAPFNITSYTSEFMTNRQAVTLADVLTKDSSVRFTGQIGGVTDSFFIRGFPISEGNLGEVAFDGVYGIAPNYHVFSTYVERAEVVKGPAALLYGMSPNSGVGGVVNIVPKRSLAEDLTRLTTDYGTGAQLGAQVDLSRRFGDERQWGIRVNALHRQGDTPLDKQYSKTDIGAVSLDYRGERLRASLDTIFQEEDIDAPTRPLLVASGIQVPDAPNGHRNVTQSWGWWKSHGQSALLHGEYDLTDKVTVFADAGGSHTGVSRLSDQTPTILNAQGDTTATPQNARFGVNRYTADVGLRARAETGPVSHNLSLQTSIYRDKVSQANNAGTAMLSNIYNPVASPEQNIARPGLPKVSSSQLTGVALADTLGILENRAQLTLGLRQQRIESDNFNATTGIRTSSYAKSAVTPLAGLVVKPWDNVSLYANYIEGLSKGDIAPATASNAGEAFKPYKAKQEEIGVKVDMGSAMVTLSAFQIRKPSGQLVGTVYEASGEQRNRGVELNLSGEPLKGLRLVGGVTYIDGKLTKSNVAANEGNRAVGVPEVMANLGAEVDIPWIPGASLNGNVIYTGKQYVNQANTQSVPSWTTFDLGARYTTKVYGKETTLRLTVLNVFNRAYWSGVASYGTISQGIPRTVMLSASMDF